MDSKSFVFGVICGAIAGGAASLLLIADDTKEVTSIGELDAESAINPVVSNVDPSTTSVQITPKVAEEVSPEPSPTSGSNINSSAPWPANIWEELEAEPKDDSWTYYMEQTLLQFLGGHPSIAQYDISKIECRASRCQIEVVGYEESTVPVWQQVMYDIRQQPWSEFGQYGSSSGTVDGRLVIVGTLHWITENE